MALDAADVVDAIGAEIGSGVVVLTLLDSLEWHDELGHLLALQKKLNSYFEFVESGQLAKVYPQSVGRRVVVDVVFRHPLSGAASQFLLRAQEAARPLGLDVRSRWLPGDGPLE